MKSLMVCLPKVLPLSELFYAVEKRYMLLPSWIKVVVARFNKTGPVRVYQFVQSSAAAFRNASQFATGQQVGALSRIK